MKKLVEDWEFNCFEIDNYGKYSFKKRYYDFIKENCEYLEGDIVEAGVYRGKSLLATGMLLKEMGSEKTVFGYDTFSGFPSCYDARDRLEFFDELLRRELITREHYEKVQRNMMLSKYSGNYSTNTSSSDAFCDVDLTILRQKMAFLGLDNVILVKGEFAETMKITDSGPKRLMACLVDCDLYKSYKTTLAYIWPLLVKGGYIFLDEYYSLKFPGARLATYEFFKDKKDKPQLHVAEAGDFERWFVRKIYGD